MKNVEKMKPILLNLKNAVSQYQEKVTVNKDSRDSFIKLSAQLGVQYNKPKRCFFSFLLLSSIVSLIASAVLFFLFFH